MNDKSLRSYLLFVFLLCGCLYSCLQEDLFFRNSRNNRFFNTEGADDFLHVIAEKLKQKNDSADFVETFVCKYGYPLWSDAYKFPENGHTVFAVPVRSKIQNREIEAIWFFSVFSRHTKYRIYTREKAERIWSKVGGDGVEETWMFDYFTRNALHRAPKSGLWFKMLVPVATRNENYYTVEHCVHAYAGYEGAEGDKGVHCWTETYPDIDEDDEEETPSESGDGSVNAGDSGSSGGNGSNNSGDIDQQVDPTQIAPKATKIFRNSNMTEQNWEVLEKMLDKIIIDCLGGELYNGLKNSLGGKTLTIQFKEGSNGSFDINKESSGISLGMQMESNQLLHEMFHAYQAYQTNLEGYKNSNMNNEIEARYAQYLYTSRLEEYKGSKWEKRDIYDISRRNIKNIANYIDEKGNLLPGISDDALTAEIVGNVIPALRKAGYTKANYPENESINGIENFKNLNKLTVNCN